MNHYEPQLTIINHYDPLWTTMINHYPPKPPSLWGAGNHSAAWSPKRRSSAGHADLILKTVLIHRRYRRRIICIMTYYSHCTYSVHIYNLISFILYYIYISVHRDECFGLIGAAGLGSLRPTYGGRVRPLLHFAVCSHMWKKQHIIIYIYI